MRTIAPKTICANASTSAVNESFLREDIEAASVINGAPRRREEEHQCDCGNHRPQHLGSPSRVRGRARLTGSWKKRRAEQGDLGDNADRCGDPEDQFRERITGWM